MGFLYSPLHIGLHTLSLRKASQKDDRFERLNLGGCDPLYVMYTPNNHFFVSLSRNGLGVHPALAWPARLAAHLTVMYIRQYPAEPKLTAAHVATPLSLALHFGLSACIQYTKPFFGPLIRALGRTKKKMKNMRFTGRVCLPLLCLALSHTA